MPRNLLNTQLWVPDNHDEPNSGSFVTELNPLPVRETPAASFMGAGYSADMMWRLAKEGRIFTAGELDFDNAITSGTTTSDSTSPTFMLDVPEGVTAIPLVSNLQQTDPVAGGTIYLYITISNVARLNNAGSARKVFNTLGGAAKSVFRSNPTVRSDVLHFGQRVWGTQMAADISPAEGAVMAGFWVPEFPILLRGPACMLWYSYAAATAPTWTYSVSWAEVPTDEFFA